MNTDPTPHARWYGRPGHLSGGNARETAYEIIRDRIIFLDFKPGEVLNDKQLAEELEMSRTPVREAIILLAAVNMVIVRPQVGTFVAPIDVEWMEIEQFSRQALESEIIRRVCQGDPSSLKTQYEENLKLYSFYEQSASPDRNRFLWIWTMNFTVSPSPRSAGTTASPTCCIIFSTSNASVC